MKKVSKLLLSVLTYMLTGYLLGLIIGFVVFAPETDLYALLSPLFAIIGAIIGIIPFFRERAFIAFGMLIGFYLGMLMTILIWGNPATDDLLEFIKGRNFSVFVALVFSIIGGFLTSRLKSSNAELPALALLLGGFLGGALFVTLDIAPSSSMVGVAPFVIGSGLVCTLAAWLLTHDRTASVD